MAGEGLNGKVCVVTGANRGLGKALSVELAKAGATVCMVCRDEGRGKAALKEVNAAAGGSRAELFLCDLASPASVRSCGESIVKAHDAIHVLVHCAAVFTKERQETKDGLETMFATNHLGPFVLTNVLLPALRRGAPARVLTVSAPTTSHLDFDDLQCAKKWAPYHAFGASKMGNLLMTFALAEREPGATVAANVVHPGLMKSDLMREAPALLRIIFDLMSKRPEVAAAKVSRLAGAPEFDGVTGKFFKGTKQAEPAAYALEEANQYNLWRQSAALAGLPP